MDRLSNQSGGVITEVKADVANQILVGGTTLARKPIVECLNRTRNYQNHRGAAGVTTAGYQIRGVSRPYAERPPPDDPTGEPME